VESGKERSKVIDPETDGVIIRLAIWLVGIMVTSFVMTKAGWPSETLMLATAWPIFLAAALFIAPFLGAVWLGARLAGKKGPTFW
jgi:hypothetical protein